MYPRLADFTGSCRYNRRRWFTLFAFEHGPGAVRPYCPAAQLPGMNWAGFSSMAVHVLARRVPTYVADANRLDVICRWNPTFHEYCFVVFKSGGIGKKF